MGFAEIFIVVVGTTPVRAFKTEPNAMEYVASLSKLDQRQSRVIPVEYDDAY